MVKRRKKNKNKTSNREGLYIYSDADIVDGPDYESWSDYYLRGAKILEIPYRELEVETVFTNDVG